MKSEVTVKSYPGVALRRVTGQGIFYASIRPMDFRIDAQEVKEM